MRFEQLFTHPSVATTLSQDITATATRVRIPKDDARLIPSIPQDGYLRMLIGSGATAERVKVLAVLDHELVVERGQFNTAATTHSAGAVLTFSTPDSENVTLAQGDGTGWRLETFTVEETITVAAAATTTGAVQIPANSRALVAMTKVLVQPPGTSTISAGVSGAATRFANGISTAVATQAITFLDETKYSSAVGVLLTPNTSPSSNAGRVQVAVVCLRAVQL